MYFPGEHKLARFSGETRKANIKIHTHTKETYQNIQNNLFYFLKAERSLLTLPFPFISFESINSEKNGFCRHPYQLVDWESGSAGSNLRAGRELMKPKEVAERRLSLLSLGSLLYYERSSQSFFNELQSCFLLPSWEGGKHHVWGRGLIYTWGSSHIFLSHLRSVPYHWQLICQVQDTRSGPQRMFHSTACFCRNSVLLISPPWEGREETGRFLSPLFGSFILSCINMESLTSCRLHC